jgi:hypothetical protein
VESWLQWASPGFSPQPALLHQTPAGDLDKFIAELLQPNRQFLAQVNKAVNTICSFLRENCFRGSPIKVLKVVKVSPQELSQGQTPLPDLHLQPLQQLAQGQA